MGSVFNANETAVLKTAMKRAHAMRRKRVGVKKDATKQPGYKAQQAIVQRAWARMRKLRGAK